MNLRSACLVPLLCLSLVGACVCASDLKAQAPKVDLIVGSQATSLEKLAAADIATDLKKIYDAQVTISATPSDAAEHLIFVGTPETLSIIKENVSEKWPNLNGQEHFLLTIKFRDKPALLVGGRADQATYWAASEYAHSLGVRPMLFGDLYPVTAKPFSLDGYEHLLKATSINSQWVEADPFPTGLTSWSLDETQRRLRQLARLKYSAVLLKTHASQPFTKDAGGLKNQREPFESIWFGWQFPVSGDTAGRSAFRGAKFFTNPDFANVSTSDGLKQAGSKWLTGLADQAASLGITLKTETDQTPIQFSSPATLDTKNQSPAFRPLVSEESVTAYPISRNRFGESLAGQAVSSSLLDPICGDGVSASVHKALEQLRSAAQLTEENDKLFSIPSPDMILKHYEDTAPAPQWWSKVRDLYLGGMNDMYRANSRAREGGRSYSLYLARRCEFGFEYMNCIDATRKAAIAGDKKDRTEQRAQLEKAIESINGACAALAAVARDPSDRGMIAMLNEFGYRPLQKELEKVEE